MIYRNVISPCRAFTQFSHELIRHPRLRSDAVRLLTWQLSLPRGATENLSRTAERAGIGATAFTRAKRQLIDEGFLHERRVQGAGGRWVTQQLVSSRPLTSDQAAKLLARTPLRTSPDPASPQVAPGRGTPVAGDPPVGDPAVDAPTPPSTDGHPDKDPGEETSNLPPAPRNAPEVEAEAVAVAVAEPEEPRAPAESPHLDDARALIGALPLLSPALRHIPPGMRDELARLAARWLDAGHSSTDVHEHVLRGLPGAGTPVHRPGGLVRYLLRAVPARELPRPAPTGTRLSPRLEGARECLSGTHTHPMLFRPVADETLCPDCRT
ncbi:MULTISPECIES: hypothetical protein [unclassified Streptomyces]|uniref:hypothetical protein n=1 Tax=unclassified Streptomyces TaxID=2593676 RepID=UPI0006F69875|nr:MULTISPECIES: hypothetical protein [unclassified Streptomyces]KQX59428.1 hypothetical protein ASD33_03885 [Streptomyces sp. Root1304]KRB00688.1 hypothetical protein ASE09_03885 [Streptomyces sp. Root66D1]